jgi:ubiquinone/menaquinone biosynthesis C-methylase UbiE
MAIASGWAASQIAGRRMERKVRNLGVGLGCSTVSLVARADYEGPMAENYDAGRTLAPEAVATWRDVLSPLLGSGSLPVLDLGAGTGRFSRLLGAWARSWVVAVEPAAAMRAQAAAKDRGRSVALVGGRAEALPLAGGAVRAALLSNVVHHFDDLALAAVELRRVICPSGVVLMRGALGRDDEGDRPCDLDFLLYRYFPDAASVAASFPGRESVIGAFAGAGFALEEERRVTQVTAETLIEFAAMVRTRADSTLAAIDDDSFARGRDHLERDAAREPQAGPIKDTMSLIVFRHR